MAPHRATPALSLIAMIQGTTAGGWTAASVAAGLAWLMGDVNLMLCIVAWGAVVGDISSGSFRAYINPAEKFTRHRFQQGAAAKFLAAHVVVLGLILDWTVRLGVPSAQPFIAAHMPWTRAALFVLIAAEGSSLQRNVRHVLALPKMFGDAFGALGQGDAVAVVRTIDAAQAGGRDELGKRWSDSIPPAPVASDAPAAGEP